jgi:hypothetical protein
MNTEQQRKEFEEWALDKVTSLTIDEIDGEYFWVETQLAWEAWQAAREQITEQCDELLRYNEAFRKETLICADCDAIRKEEYDQAIEQRDRLAEALRKAISWGDSASHHILYRENINWTYLDEAREALQSLTTNETSAAAGGERKDHE